MQVDFFLRRFEPNHKLGEIYLDGLDLPLFFRFVEEIPAGRWGVGRQGGSNVSTGIDDILSDADILQVVVCPFYVGEGIEGSHEAGVDFGLIAEAPSAGDELGLFGGFYFEVV